MRSGPYTQAGLRRDAGMGIRYQPQIDPTLMKRLQQLSPKLQRTIQRRAMRQALTVFKKLATPLYRRHRTNIPRKHLDQSLAVKTRTYRRGKTTVYWGAMGFRMGAQKNKVSLTKRYENDWAGWRAHFLERGFTATGAIQNRNVGQFRSARLMERQRIKSLVAAGGGRWVRGREYLPKVLAVGRGAAREAFDHAVSTLIRTEGKKGWRMPRPFLSSELRRLSQ
jgi:hypothetical protein